MKKNLYATAWILLAIAGFISIVTGTLTLEMLLVYSLLALGLVYGLALWLVITNARQIKTE